MEECVDDIDQKSMPSWHIITQKNLISGLNPNMHGKI